MAVSGSKMTLKLLFDAGNNKVLFAEAGKEVIDFMFSLLLLPLGSIIKLVTPGAMVGSIGKLYQSIEHINDTYLVANLRKSTLLQPTALAGASPLLLTGTVGIPQPKKTYNCPHCQYAVNTCRSCNRAIDWSLVEKMNSGAGNGGYSVEGFVKGVVTYMITDDLEITPMSAISSITLINRFSKKKDVQLEEKTVVVGMEQGLALLAASLKSTTALTDVFLNSSTKKVASFV